MRCVGVTANRLRPMAAAAALFGVLAAAVGCGSDTPSAQSSGSQTSPTSDDVVRIHYVASGKMAGWPWSFEQELIADAKPLRTRLTQTAQGAEDGGWPVGYFIASYQSATSRPWGRSEVQDAWAAGLWVRLFNARKDAADGGGPQLDRLEGEVDERLTLAALD